MAKTNILTRGKKARAEQLALGGHLDQAEVLYGAVCKADPKDAEALVKLGIIQSRLGRHAEAEARVRRAVLLAPQMLFAREVLATILQHRSKADEATAVLRCAVGEAPHSSESILNLGRLLEKQGRMQEAFAQYHRALDLQRETSYVLAKRAELMEREGRVDEASRIVDRGLAAEPCHPELNLVAARLERREGNEAAAVVRLEALLSRPLSRDAAADARILLAQLHDRLGNDDRVMPLLMQGRRRIAQVTDPEGRDAHRFLERIAASRAWLNPRLRESVGSSSRSVDDPPDAPIFVIGFLRSGTTLLEQVLDSHPGLQALNEKPMGPVVEQAFIEMTGGGNDALSALTDAQAATLRAVYWREAARHCTRQAGTRLVDKEPLNLIRVPLLWRIFPDARFVLTLRHPCDVTLACLMQNFGYANVMSAFADLESMAAVYDRVMAAWQDYATHLPMHWQAIRYEDLITAFEPEVRKLLAFLGLDWSDAVLGHTEHAQTRGIINTPSYHQVTVPIYQHAKYRWKRYERDFASVIGVLEPYIERFGYSATAAELPPAHRHDGRSNTISAPPPPSTSRA